MSLNINNVTLAGNLTRDPELRNAGGKSVCQFGIAINRKWKGKDGEAKEEAIFVDVEAWEKTGELVSQYLAKGSPCYIEGRLKLDSWEDKDGGKRTKLKVVATNVQFLGTPKKGGEATSSPLAQQNRSAIPAAAPVYDDASQPPF